MIVVVCMDDTDVLEAAVKQSALEPQTFGDCYRAFFGYIPQLDPTENLFISAHGTDANIDGVPVIGNEGDDVYDFSGQMLYRNLQSIFPPGYAGGVYISACHSADAPRPGLTSFIEAFKHLVHADFPAAKVFGVRGEVPLAIFPPNSEKWVQA